MTPDAAKAAVTPLASGWTGRRIAGLAAYLSGAVTAAGALGLGVLCGQVLVARRAIPGAEAPPPRCDGDYGADLGRPPLRVAMIGDSTAAGYGVEHRAQTPGALLASGIARAARRPVRLTCTAVVGSVSAWLPAQVELAMAAGVQLAVILIGANDVTTRAGRAEAVGHLSDAVRTLRSSGVEVVVATCPDLGTIRPIRPPLRWLAGHWSHRLAAAQTVAVVAAGGRTVSLGDLLGPRFAAAPDRLFAPDRYHPSAEGYREAAAVILPSALAALGLGPAEPAAAAPAAGIEVAGATLANLDRRLHARWARLARRARAGAADPARSPASKRADEAVPSNPESPDATRDDRVREERRQTAESR